MTTKKSNTRGSQFRKTIEAHIDLGETNIGATIDAAEHEADKLLLQMAVRDVAGSDVTEAICRIVASLHPEVDTQTEALNEYLMQQQPPVDIIPDGITGLVAYTHGDAGYFLGLAIGRRLGGAR